MSDFSLLLLHLLKESLKICMIFNDERNEKMKCEKKCGKTLNLNLNLISQLLLDDGDLNIKFFIFFSNLNFNF